MKKALAAFALLGACYGAPLVAGVKDSDKDGLSDSLELDLAGQFSPYLIWDEKEKCALHQTFYQVHPLSEGEIGIVYALTFPLDCGFRSTMIDAHWGDTHPLKFTLTTNDGKTWTMTQNNLGSMNQLQWHQNTHPVVYLSAGKHHTYLSAQECEDKYSLSLDDCSGGAESIEPILSTHNVGEEATQLITSLGAFGQGPYSADYAKETAWGPSGWNDQKFCGGSPKRNKVCATTLGLWWYK